MFVRLAIVAAVAVVAAAGLTFRDASAEVAPSLIRISATETQYARVDIGRRGRSPGDMEVIRQLLYNRRITPKPIGHAETVCTFAFDTSRNCRTTYFLPRGSLQVGGSFRFRQIYELAILGGTGFYREARGTLTATRTRRSPRREFLVFRLTG